MRTLLVFIHAMLFLGLATASAGAASVWEGVFTVEQTARGELAYFQYCVHCHQPDLAGNGDLIPAVAGPSFIALVDGLALSSLLDYISFNMPFDNPNAVGAWDYLDILTYILAVSGFPPGENELPLDEQTLRNIFIEMER